MTINLEVVNIETRLVSKDSKNERERSKKEENDSSCYS